jgi:predicted aspartyl protease
LTRNRVRNHIRLVVFTALSGLQINCLLAQICTVVQHRAPTEADKALLAADFVKAASLYKAGLTGHPGDVELTSGLVLALLRQQRVKEAADEVNASLASAPGSAALISLRGEVELREGTPWVAAQSAAEADKLDPCNPRNHLLLAVLERMSSLYASSRDQLKIAHQLDSVDPEIRREWIHTLPLEKRIEETESYLSAPNGEDDDELRRWRMYLDGLKKMKSEPRKSCHLVSATDPAAIPFVEIMRDATHRRAFGLEVALNGHASRFQIDTGAGGLLVSQSVAENAGLKPFSQKEMRGIGDEGSKQGYSAYVDSIRIGSLEFQDCQVRVVESRSVLDDSDGLIGMDVFSNFLVTLDYPSRRLLLGPLPVRPGESANPAPALKTGDVERDDSLASTEALNKPEMDKPGDTSPAAGAAVLDTGSSASPPVEKTAPRGPHDRYIAPEMRSYTPVYRVGHNLMLPVSLNDAKARLFILDTGSWTTVVSPEAAGEVAKVHSDDRIHVHGISGQVDKVYTADDITFHFAHLSQKAREVVSFDTSRISKSAGTEVSGFLGATTLGLLTIHIDYRDGLVKFDYDPNRGYRF